MSIVDKLKGQCDWSPDIKGKVEAPGTQEI